MMSNSLEIPAQFDRRTNGRCRAFWMAHDKAPGHTNPYDWAEKNWEKFLTKAQLLDEKEGPLPACKPLKTKKLKPIRTRARNVSK